MKKLGLMIVEDIDKVHVVTPDVTPDDIAFGRYKPLVSFDTFAEAELFVRAYAKEQGQKIVDTKQHFVIGLRK